jgi:RNA-directed DNA polymerase
MIIAQISRDVGLSSYYLTKIERTASHRYKTYAIPKAKGGGTRIIHHPARELKLVQSWLIQNVFSSLAIHPAATAYHTGSSILKNARIHIAGNFLLRVDFKNFFPSLTDLDVREAISRNRASAAVDRLNERDVEFITSIVCRKIVLENKSALTIGAPSSPVLSNAIMFEFDRYWSDRSKELGLSYSRYADDVYFSSNIPRMLNKVLTELREYLTHLDGPRLQINEDKTIFTSRKHLRRVTGLVLTSDRKVSIGRAKKRFLKSMVAKMLGERLDEGARNSLKGWIAYVRSVEPEFIAALERKYRVDLRERLQ